MCRSFSRMALGDASLAYLEAGALTADGRRRPRRPDRVWNRIADATRGQIIDMALVEPELAPRELAMRFADQQS